MEQADNKWRPGGRPAGFFEHNPPDALSRT